LGSQDEHHRQDVRSCSSRLAWPVDFLEAEGNGLVVRRSFCTDARRPAEDGVFSAVRMDETARVDTELRRELRAALYQADGDAIMAAVASIDLSRYLQTAGDALLIAVSQGSAGSVELAARCADLLREGPGRIDLATGQVHTPLELQYADDEYDDETDDGDADEATGDGWLWIEPEGSGPGYRDMERFAATVTEPAVAAMLSVALDGKGAFRRFRNTLTRWPDIEDDWYRYSDERRRGRARTWLVDQGYRPHPPRQPRHT
jgi:hypothetical protein